MAKILYFTNADFPIFFIKYVFLFDRTWGLGILFGQNFKGEKKCRPLVRIVKYRPARYFYIKNNHERLSCIMKKEE